ncbi:MULTISPECIES: HU family DNA-binding protein [unclassified Kitasatospora]|uniref:HU family DNA-binding protein n=1 Tax=unclassified Kitasatospora TaxID=2633591 RepID=UPI0033F7E0ED
MNKQELIDLVAEDADVAKETVNKVLGSMLQTIKNSVAAGDAVQLLGFGSFSPGERAARTGRNPQTGEPMEIGASRTVKFTMGKELKDAVNAR